MNRKMLVRLIKDTFRDWMADNAPLMAAGLSYYAILALAPLLVLALLIMGRLYPDEAQARITVQITRLAGLRIARAVGAILDEARQPSGLLPLAVSAATLFVATSGTFAQLMNALDVIWKVRPTGERGLRGRVLDRLLAFGMVVIFGLLLLSTFLATAIIAQASRVVPIMDYAPLWNILLSLALTTLLFAAIFKVLPRVHIAWRDVWIGAFVTAVLFVIGKELIGLYLSFSNVTSAYGLMGSLIILLIFVYFSAQILLLGAEFTKHYARRLGSRPPIEKYAVRYRMVTEKEGSPASKSAEEQPAERKRPEHPAMG
ncbi:MAG: YihY/virulence factor BrkB family protein, partial [Chloroflexota bacterium]